MSLFSASISIFKSTRWLFLQPSDLLSEISQLIHLTLSPRDAAGEGLLLSGHADANVDVDANVDGSELTDSAYTYSLLPPPPSCQAASHGVGAGVCNHAQGS